MLKPHISSSRSNNLKLQKLPSQVNKFIHFYAAVTFQKNWK